MMQRREVSGRKAASQALVVIAESIRASRGRKGKEAVKSQGKEKPLSAGKAPSADLEKQELAADVASLQASKEQATFHSLPASNSVTPLHPLFPRVSSPSSNKENTENEALHGALTRGRSMSRGVTRGLSQERRSPLSETSNNRMMRKIEEVSQIEKALGAEISEQQKIVELPAVSTKQVITVPQSTHAYDPFVSLPNLEKIARDAFLEPLEIALAPIPPGRRGRHRKLGNPALSQHASSFIPSSQPLYQSSEPTSEVVAYKTDEQRRATSLKSGQQEEAAPFINKQGSLSEISRAIKPKPQDIKDSIRESETQKSQLKFKEAFEMSRSSNPEPPRLQSFAVQAQKEPVQNIHSEQNARVPQKPFQGIEEAPQFSKCEEAFDEEKQNLEEEVFMIKDLQQQQQLSSGGALDSHPGDNQELTTLKEDDDFEEESSSMLEAGTGTAKGTDMGGPQSQLGNQYQGRWTDEEHDKFIEGLQLFGKDWRRIEEFIGSRTCAQIRSHAQKYFNRLQRDIARGIKRSDEHQVSFVLGKKKKRSQLTGQDLGSLETGSAINQPPVKLIKADIFQSERQQKPLSQQQIYQAEPIPSQPLAQQFSTETQPFEQYKPIAEQTNQQIIQIQETLQKLTEDDLIIQLKSMVAHREQISMEVLCNKTTKQAAGEALIQLTNQYHLLAMQALQQCKFDICNRMIDERNLTQFLCILLSRSVTINPVDQAHTGSGIEIVQKVELQTSPKQKVFQPSIPSFQSVLTSSGEKPLSQKQAPHHQPPQSSQFKTPDSKGALPQRYHQISQRQTASQCADDEVV